MSDRVGGTENRWFWFVVVIVLIGIAWTITQDLWRSRETDTLPKSNPVPADLTAKQHLAAAKDALKNKPANGYVIGEIEKHLMAIPTDAPEHKEVPSLLAKTAGEEKRLVKEFADKVRRDAVRARQTYVEELEKVYLKNGYDVHLSATGADKTIFTFKFVLVSRPLVYQLSQSDKFIGQLRSRGFKKAIFTDGYDSSWHLDL